MGDFHRLEFFRSGFGLQPGPKDKDPGVTLSISFVPGAVTAPGQCTCRDFLIWKLLTAGSISVPPAFSDLDQLLQTLEIGFVSLNGASVHRGEIVRRFNEDERCRVFLGSLKAGGTGIDLIAGTVVIHYDRWWNAAREDQATDRCHGIGQKRAVQVFKLIAEGTLEEKISAIIERKRRLMEAVVQPDNPRLQKIFTRDELIDLLTPV